MNNGRERNGRFARGNPGGPGRPRRKIEVEYLATLSDQVSLDDWRKIVRQAVDDAISGDAQARRWLSQHLLGGGGNLLRLAANEASGRTPDDEIRDVLGGNEACSHTDL